MQSNIRTMLEYVAGAASFFLSIIIIWIVAVNWSVAAHPPLMLKLAFWTLALGGPASIYSVMRGKNFAIYVFIAQALIVAYLCVFPILHPA